MYTILRYHWLYAHVTLREIAYHAIQFGVIQKDSNSIFLYLSWPLYLGWFKSKIYVYKISVREYAKNPWVPKNHPKLIYNCIANNHSILWSVNTKAGFVETRTILHFNWISLSSAWSQRRRCLKRYSNVLGADPLPLKSNFLFQDVILMIDTISTKIFKKQKNNESSLWINSLLIHRKESHRKYFGTLFHFYMTHI